MNPTSLTHTHSLPHTLTHSLLEVNEIPSLHTRGRGSRVAVLTGAQAAELGGLVLSVSIEAEDINWGQVVGSALRPGILIYPPSGKGGGGERRGRHRDGGCCKFRRERDFSPFFRGKNERVGGGGGVPGSHAHVGHLAQIEEGCVTVDGSECDSSAESDGLESGRPRLRLMLSVRSTLMCGRGCWWPLPWPRIYIIMHMSPTGWPGMSGLMMHTHRLLARCQTDVAQACAVLA